MDGSQSSHDEHLMVCYQRGDIDAFALLYDRYSALIASYLHRMSGSADLAEALAQETFLRVVEHRDRFDPARRFRSWLYTIARNLLRDEWKRRSRSPVGDESFETELAAGSSPSPAELAELSEDRARLLRALGELPAAQREVVILHEFERLTCREIAEMTEEPVGTIRSRIFHALSALRRAM